MMENVTWKSTTLSGLTSKKGCYFKISATASEKSRPGNVSSVTNIFPNKAVVTQLYNTQTSGMTRIQVDQKIISMTAFGSSQNNNKNFHNTK